MGLCDFLSATCSDMFLSDIEIDRKSVSFWFSALKMIISHGFGHFRFLAENCILAEKG